MHGEREVAKQVILDFVEQRGIYALARYAEELADLICDEVEVDDKHHWRSRFQELEDAINDACERGCKHVEL